MENSAAAGRIFTKFYVEIFFLLISPRNLFLVKLLIDVLREVVYKSKISVWMFRLDDVSGKRFTENQAIFLLAIFVFENRNFHELSSRNKAK